MALAPSQVCSKKCRLAGKSPTELVEMKEEASEVGGYFIVNGNEKIIRLLQVGRSAPHLLPPPSMPRV